MPPNIVDKKRVNYNKEGKKKSREKRKAMGLEVKHKQATKAVSGIRTKKHQRKVAHREKMAAKDAAKAAAIAQEMQVEAAPAAPAASTKRKAKAGKAKASDAMQE